MRTILLILVAISGTIYAEIISDVVPTLITSDVAGSHQTTANDTSTSFNQDVDGVGLMFISIPGVGNFNCTGSLLSTGRHIITAAHCVTDINTGEFIDGTTANISFDTAAGGGFEEVINISNFAIHPNWNGDAVNGFDIAILTLESTASNDVTRYDINRNLAIDTTAEFTKAGYGVSGFGDTGQDPANFPAGTKRAGKNKYEGDGDILDIIGFGAGDNILIYDYDNGLLANDAQTFIGLPSDLGFGDDEVNGAPGDSGGPTFLDDGTIVGIASFGLGLNGGPDVSPGSDFSFGEFSGDTRVALLADFVDAQVVPEPSTYVMLLILIGLVGFKKKK